MLLLLLSRTSALKSMGVSRISGGTKSAFRLMAAATMNSKTTIEPKKLHGADAADLLNKTDCFIFDCDGVIWKGDFLVNDQVPGVLEKLRAMGKKIFFVTNNSTKSRKGYLKKFTGLGLNVNPEGTNITLTFTIKYIF